MIEQAVHGLDVGAEDREAMERGFEYGQTEAFLTAGEEEGVGELIESREVEWCDGEMFADKKGGDFEAELCATGEECGGVFGAAFVVWIGGAGDERDGVATAPAELGDDFEAELDVLSAQQPRGMNQDEVAIEKSMLDGEVGYGGSEAKDFSGLNAVGDDLDGDAGCGLHLASAMCG
jgi:hypothetical protein